MAAKAWLDGKTCYKCPRADDNGMPPSGGCIETVEWVSGEITDRCPVMYYDDFSVVFEAANNKKDGILPLAGGWLDQPATLMAMVAIVEDERRKMEAKANG